MWIENFQMYKLDLEKAEEPEIKLSTSRGMAGQAGSAHPQVSGASLDCCCPRSDAAKADTLPICLQEPPLASNHPALKSQFV